MQPYFNRRNELYEELGCVMWGHRLVVPEKCREKVLNMIHEPHMGVVKSKAIARSYVWWAGVDEAVERVCRACAVCAAQADAPPRVPHSPWPWPARPWTRLHLDFMGPIFGKTYLIVVDSTSKWIEVFPVPSTAANWTIDKLVELWGRWGIPKQLVSDNGPPYSSSEFAKFTRSYGIDHIFAAPYHPSSNGAAENAVRTIKRVVKKAMYEKQSIDRALHTFLLYYRNTEHATTGQSPSMLLQGRRLRTRLDALRADVGGRVSRMQRRQLGGAASGATNREIHAGEDVWYRQYLRGEKWEPGKVINKLGPKNMEVRGIDGSQVHRHVDQLRRRSRNSLVFPAKDKQENPNVVNTSDTADVVTVGVSPRGSEAQSERGAGSVTPARAQAPPPATPSGSPEESADQFLSPESSPASVPPQSRPIRTCNLHKNPKYRF
ncbi:uncharacterized protein K02A2.6-like [Plutella xylostella]|uniref:uncharacterized protein K02A2.6-like n=1 Tax=Plutella xylostella TaxID=51655 RepID=UPI002032D6E3|nr:uncharacterized protein K02A2.6-like [Plutella xylostella]